MWDGRASGRVRADTFNVPLVIQLTDDEKFLWKDMKVGYPSLPSFTALYHPKGFYHPHSL